METERKTFEPSRLCRACGAERLQMFPLSARDPDSGFRLDDMFMACTDLKIHVGDGFPSSICYDCADELKTSYRFKQRCETTDRYFNELGLKSNEMKQEQDMVVFKEGENENLLELKEEKDTNDNSRSLSFVEVTEGVSEAIVISRETKQEQGDPLSITETIIYKQETNFSEVTEDEVFPVGNFGDSPRNEDNEEFPSGSKQQKEETIQDCSSEASFSSKDDDSDHFSKEELRKTNRLGHFECNIRGKYSSSSNLRVHKQTHENDGRKRFKCETCEKSFSTNWYLQEHKKTHENVEQKYNKCNVCEKTFSTSWYLREHKLRHENGEQKRFNCDVCKKSFSASWYLQEHKKTHENDEQKYYKCNVCEKSFSARCSLQKHKEMHENGERKSFKCDICKQSFSKSWNLQQHKLRHDNGERKSFKCDICKKSFAYSGNLREHKLTHENGGRKSFQCDICGKSFATSGYLQKHKRRHENGKRKSFECDVCEKSFTVIRNLREHKLKHENGGRKRFKCDTCEKSFSWSSCLLAHKKTHKNNIL